jgi:cytochrome bd ubiquinol oxidase subunit II
MIGEVWFAVILLCLVMYVTLDGYDLGIGINLLFVRRARHRRYLVDVVATAWDGNESWLILLAVALWGGFPLAFGAMLPYLFLPMIFVLFGLIVRGVSIEMVSESEPLHRGWLAGFTFGSLIAAFAQGVVFGGLTSNVTMVDGAFAGSAFDVFTPYSMLTGAATVLLYATLGAGFIRLKADAADAEISERASRDGRVFLGFATVLCALCALSINATDAPLQLGSPARMVLFALLALVAAGGAVVAFVTFPRPPRAARSESPDGRPLADSQGSRSGSLPFVGMTASVTAGLLAYAVARYPTIVPPDLTIATARAPSQTLDFLLIGVGLNIPLVLFYNWYAHREFRGKYRVPKEQRPPGTSALSYALSPSRRRGTAIPAPTAATPAPTAATTAVKGDDS